MAKFVVVVVLCFMSLIYVEFCEAQSGGSVLDLVPAKEPEASKKTNSPVISAPAVSASPVQSLRPANPRPLTEEDKKLLEIGEIGWGAHIVGGVIGTYIGFGLGHSIQGRYSYDGWIFTTGEGLGVVAFALGIANCDHKWSNEASVCGETPSLLIAGGLLSFVGFRVYEIFDVWFHPWQLNKKIRRLEKAYPNYFPSFYLLPSENGRFTANLSWDF